MEIKSTATRIKQEYKDYLRQEHPDWLIGDINTHIASAFYAYENSITLPFWQYGY